MKACIFLITHKKAKTCSLGEDTSENVPSYGNHNCDMIYSMEAKVGISKVEIQVKIGCGGEFGKNELFMW